MVALRLTNQVGTVSMLGSVHHPSLVNLLVAADHSSVLIKPITICLIAYGQRANVVAIRGRAADLLKEEHGSV